MYMYLNLIIWAYHLTVSLLIAEGAISLSLYGTEGRGTWGRLEVVGAVKRTTIVEILEKNFGELLPPVPHPLPTEEFPLSVLTGPLAADSSLSVRLQLSPALRLLHFRV
ncbi:hypothetical protein QQP08_020606, partial [Theobroma cacao]